MLLWRHPQPPDCRPYFQLNGVPAFLRTANIRQTCRIRGRPTFPVLVDAVTCLFKGQTPDLRWITHHEPLLACAAP